MIENDEQMLIRFFEENRQEIEDDGFTQRVVRQLPSRAVRISQVWSWICWLLGIALFFMMDGVGQLYRVAILFFHDVINMFSSVNLSIYSMMIILALIFTMISVKMYQIAME